MDQQVLRQAVQYLTVLDLERSSTLADVRRAYRFQAQTWNPNGLPDEARLRDAAKRRQANAKHAYDWLMQNAEVLRELEARSDPGVDDERQGSPADESPASWLRRRLKVIGIRPVIAANGVLYVLLVGLLLYNIIDTYASNRESLSLNGPLNVIAADGKDPVNGGEIPSEDRMPPDRFENQSEAARSAPGSSTAEPRQRDPGNASDPAAAVGSASFTVEAGSSRTDVIRILGAPISIERRTVHREELWYYSDLIVTFSADTDIVIRVGQAGAENNRGVDPGRDTPETWSIGSHKDDVARIQGSPARIERLREAGQEVWHFGESTVTFSVATDLVVGWDDSGSNLRASPPTNLQPSR